MNIRDVAMAAGVSPATVSRVLNPEAAAYPVRRETRDRVLETITRMGYRPNDLARALLHHRTNVVGLVVPDISNPYYPEIARGVEDAASTAGCRVVLCNTDRDVEKTNKYLETLVKSRVDGIIIAGGGTNVAFNPQLFEPYDTKVVLVGRHDHPYPSVQINNAEAARNATAHLIELGHRSIAFVAGPLASNTVQDRIVGYRRALADGYIPMDDQLLREGDFQEAGGYKAALSLLDDESARPTAIVAANDRMAIGAMTALFDRGFSIPTDVSLIGFDDIPLATYIRPALTTVAVPSYELGYAAMEMLVQGPPGAERPTHMLATQLVVRDSCTVAKP